MSSVIGVTITLFAVVGFYMLPTIAAGLRKKEHSGGVVILNIFLGWTVIGWIIALAWAFSGETKSERLAAGQR